MKGFKADLSKICGCEIYIVGRTKKDLLDNLKRHMKDVHRVWQITGETFAKLTRVAEGIG